MNDKPYSIKIKYRPVILKFGLLKRGRSGTEDKKYYDNCQFLTNRQRSKQRSKKPYPIENGRQPYSHGCSCNKTIFLSFLTKKNKYGYIVNRLLYVKPC